MKTKIQKRAETFAMCSTRRTKMVEYNLKETFYIINTLSKRSKKGMKYSMEKQRLSKKILHICIVLVIIIAIFFTAIMFVLHYNEKGETNMPFEISKISIISTVDGKNVENSEYKWDVSAIQNNDVYIYIEKNEEYKKQETIKSIEIDNIEIKNAPKIGEIKIYKPSTKENVLFQNIEENEINQITYNGTQKTDTKNCEISNQGGIIDLGVIVKDLGNNSVGEFQSNDEDEIKYDKLLEKMNIDENNLKATISFNIIISLDSRKSFKAENVEFVIPNEGIVNKGIEGIENKDLQDIVFKRIEN